MEQDFSIRDKDRDVDVRVRVRRTSFLPRKYREPRSYEEALLRRDDLEDDIDQIESQLREPTRVHLTTGRVLGSGEFATWKHKAENARLHKRAELRAIKRWIELQQVSIAAVTVHLDPDSPNALLIAAAKVLRGMKKDEVEFDEFDTIVLDALESYNRRRVVFRTEPQNGNENGNGNGRHGIDR